MKVDCISIDTDQELSWRDYLSMRKDQQSDNDTDDVTQEKIRSDKAALNDEIFQLQERADQQLRASKVKKPSKGHKATDTKHTAIPINANATVVDDLDSEDWEVEVDTLRGNKNV